jgi:hypothetical protein
MAQLVLGISHVHVVVPHVEPLLGALTATLGLQRISGPATITRGDYDATFANVYAENAWIEIIRYGTWGKEWEARNPLTARVLRSAQHPDASIRVTGVALEPIDLESQEMELRRRRISHEPSGEWESGSFRGYVRRLHGVVKDNADVFFSYDEIRRGDTWVRSRARASAEVAAAHRASGGGPLGLRGIGEIVIGAVRLSEELDVWQRLLGPLEQREPGLWCLEQGPAVRVEECDGDAIVRLVFDVASLDGALDALRSRAISAERFGEAWRIDPDVVMGLDVRLRERP